MRSNLKNSGILVAVAMILFFGGSYAYSQTTEIYIEGPSEDAMINLKAGDLFYVDVKIRNAVDLFAYQFKLNYRGFPGYRAVAAVKATEGDFLKAGGMTWFGYKIDSFEESILVYDVVLGGRAGGVSVSGDGTLARIWFVVKPYYWSDSYSIINMTFSDVILLDGTISPIPYTATGYTFNNAIKADFTYSFSGRLEVIFDGSISKSNVGPIISYQWDFGDGTTGEGMIVSHVYRKPDSYTVTLRVSAGWSKSIWSNGEYFDTQSYTIDVGMVKTTATVDLVHRAAWPEEQWVHSGGEGIAQKLYARVRNFSNNQTYKVKVKFTVSNQPDKNSYTLYTSEIDLKQGAEEVVSVARDFSAGMYVVTAQALYWDGNVWKAGERVKRFGFPVLK